MLNFVNDRAGADSMYACQLVQQCSQWSLCNRQLNI